jgi:hypothetical protein
LNIDEPESLDMEQVIHFLRAAIELKLMKSKLTSFVLGGIVLSTIVRLPELWLVVLLLVATFFIHKSFNYLAFKLKLNAPPFPLG